MKITAKEVILVDIENVPSLKKRTGISDRSSRISFYANFLRGELGIDTVIFCGDSTSCWRSEVFPKYKNKNKTNAYNSNYAHYETLLECECALFAVKNGWEADDIIGYAARSGRFDRIVIVSDDSDFKQLHFFKCVERYSPKEGTLEKRNNVFGIRSLVEKLVMGDSRDNITRSGQSRCRVKLRPGQKAFKKIAQRVKDTLVQKLQDNPSLTLRELRIRDVILNECGKTFEMNHRRYMRNYKLICQIEDTHSHITT